MNLKRVFFAAATAGLLTVTGCAGNTPENNHGNRTGENINRNINRNFNYGRTRSNVDINRDGVYTSDRYNYDNWNNFQSPAPGIRRTTRPGNQLRRFRRTTGRTANVTARPTAAVRNQVNPRAVTRNRNAWDSSIVNRNTDVTVRRNHAINRATDGTVRHHNRATDGTVRSHNRAADGIIRNRNRAADGVIRNHNRVTDGTVRNHNRITDSTVRNYNRGTAGINNYDNNVVRYNDSGTVRNFNNSTIQRQVTGTVRDYTNR